MINQTDEGIVLEQLIPWPELLNSHYYHPDEQQLRNILIQLVTGLVECRNNGICYSDIHYNNVFVSKDGTYKWGDFGIAYYTNADGSIPRQLIGADGIPFGSRWFMAPETFHDRVFTESSAVYALAVLAYFVMNDMRFLTQEHFVALYLSTKNQVIHKQTLFIGSLNASIVHPREVVRP